MKSSNLSMTEIPAYFNVAEFFITRHISESRGDNTALVCGGAALTYREINAMVNRCGNALRSLGVEEEQRVLIALPDCLEFVVAYFAAMKIGAVAVPTTSISDSDDYLYFLSETRARVLIIDENSLPKVEPVISRCPYLKKVIVRGQAASPHLRWLELSKESPEIEPARTLSSTVAFWLWTSGSTGPAKPVVHLHRDWVYCCESYARGVLGITSEDRTFCSSKVCHPYGLGASIMFPFYVGGTGILCGGESHPKMILEHAARLRPTLFFSTPSKYALMLRETERNNPFDLSSIRLSVSAVERLSGRIPHRWRERFGSEILDGVGSTEILHIYLSARPGNKKVGSSGSPVPGYEVRLMNDQGQPLSRGATGTLWVRAPSMAVGYWNRPELTRERMQGAWFVTGDRFYEDEDGYFWFVGRTDDTLRIGAQWISPLEIEESLLEHPAVNEAIVLPYEDEDGLFKPRAYIALRPNSKAGTQLAAAIEEFLGGRLFRKRIPVQIVFVDKLPRTPAGKVQRIRLQRPPIADI